jgi:predicted transcriptional regulator
MNACEEPMAEREVVLGFAAEIISAHISNNAIQTDQLPWLIQQVFNTLSSIEQISVPPQPTPAVPVKKSVRSERIICLDCGKHFSMIKRHLMTDHRLTPQQYRQRWDLPPSYPLVAPAYAKVRSALAKEWGLGRKGLAKRGMAREPLAEDVWTHAEFE